MFKHDISDPTMEEVATSHTVDVEKEPTQKCVQPHMNHTEPVLVNNDVEAILQQNVKMNVDPNMEHLDQILVKTVEGISEEEDMTYISIYDKIKSLIDPFKKFKNTQLGQLSKSQPYGQILPLIYYGFGCQVELNVKFSFIR